MLAENLLHGFFDQFFDNYVSGTVELDFAACLAYAGLNLEEEAVADSKPQLGIDLRERNGSLVIGEVEAESPAFEAGLNVDDEVIALNRHRINSTYQLQNLLAMFEQDSVVALSVFRDEKLREFNIKLKNRQVPNFLIKRVTNPTTLQRAIYEEWLGETWPENDAPIDE